MNTQTLAICTAILGGALVIALVGRTPTPQRTEATDADRFAEVAEAIRGLRDVLSREEAPLLRGRDQGGSHDGMTGERPPATPPDGEGLTIGRTTGATDPSKIESLGEVDPVLFSSVWAGSERALLSDRKLEVTLYLLRNVSEPRSDQPTHAVYMRVLEQIDSAKSLDGLRAVLMRYPLLFRSGDLHSYVESR